MKTIELTQGQVALVDDEDYEELSKHKWSACWHPHARTFYAARHSGKTTMPMHCQIMGERRGQKIDHIDHNGLNNQRYNLRACTNGQNIANSRKHRDGYSRYKGVCKDWDGKGWRAQITVNGIKRHLGRFMDEESAARVYDQALREAWGDFALTNF
jgi:hypothetical protein